MKISSVGVETSSSMFMRARAVMESREKKVFGTEKTFGSKEIAMAAHTSNLPDGMEKGLDATDYYDPPNMTYQSSRLWLALLNHLS